MKSPIFTDEQRSEIKKQDDALLVPSAMWAEHIEGNPRIRYEDFLPTPGNQMVNGYVVTEKEWFIDIVRSLKNLYFEHKRLNGMWFITKLELKKHMPKIDIFDAGRRAPGSHGSH